MQSTPAGFHHPLVRAARTLHLKKHRLERRCFLVEGPTAVEAALGAAHVQIDYLFVAAGHARADAIAEAAASGGHKILAVDDRTMRSLAQTHEPQGIIAAAKFFHREIDGLSVAVGEGVEPTLVIVLHAINDPGNAGTLIRSAEALGASAVCFGPGAVDPYNSKVVRASMGSIFHIPVFAYADWRQFAVAAHRTGLSIVAAEAGADDVRAITLPVRVALVIGHERHGVADIPTADIACRIGIPQLRRAESLNAAVAGSILIYEIARTSGRLPERPD